MRNPIDLSVYLVLDANLCKTPQKMVEVALEAVNAGATVVQLRAPEWKKRRLLEAARLLKTNLQGRVPLIINDHLDVALLSGAEGVHLGQDDISVDDARAVLGDKAIIGLSAGNLQELPEKETTVDYLGVGPVFATATKKDAGSAIGIEGLLEVIQNTDLPIVAIGGIHAGNAPSVMQAHTDGIAVVSAICASLHPAQATQELVEIVSKAKYQ